MSSYTAHSFNGDGTKVDATARIMLESGRQVEIWNVGEVLSCQYGNSETRRGRCRRGSYAAGEVWCGGARQAVGYDRNAGVVGRCGQG